MVQLQKYKYIRTFSFVEYGRVYKFFKMADFYDNDVVFKALNELRKKRKGQFIENITAVIKMNYGWSTQVI